MASIRISLGKILSAAIAIIVLAVAFVLFISIRQSQQVKQTASSVSHTEEILLHLQQLILAVLDNETGARGFIITGTDRFLEPLHQSESNAGKQLNILSSLISNTEVRRLLKDSLTFYVDKRISFSRHMINTYYTQGRQAAADLVLTGEGKLYTDRIRTIVSDMETRMNVLLAVRKENSNNTINRLNITLYSMLAAGFILSLLIIHRIRKETGRQKENEEKFSALLDAAPDATVIVNEKGIIVRVNKQIENIFGYTRNEIVGHHVEMMIPLELRQRHVQHRADFVKEAGTRPMGMGLELKAVRKNGDTFPVEISLSPMQTRDGLLVSASIRDITERKKQEQKFKSFLDSAPDATIIVNDKGIIQMINHQTENLFGYSREDLLGQAVEILIPAALREKHIGHRAGFMHAAKIRLMGAGIELKAVKKNGAQFPVEISLSPIETEEGILVSASVRDISLRKELEDELKKSNAEMEAFTYSVSHDLRAPLRGIIGFTAILEEDYTSRLDDEAKRITSVIKANTLKMGHLIDDLLAFSRTGKQEIIKTAINTLTMIEEIIAELIPQTKQPVSWHIGELPVIKADLNTIRQVWINLLSNAIKYSSKNGNPHIKISSYIENGCAVFAIKDNGVGFDEQYRHKLFKVFQRLHDAEEFEGTGVGLALVEKIVSRHGGKVWAEGKKDEGACFYFSLPL